jgi:hypothetical protein
MTAADQQAPRPGDPDIAEPQLLELVELSAGLIEALQAGRTPLPNLGKGPGVATQPIGKNPAAPRPAGPAAARGEHGRGQVGHYDHVPFEPFGLVYGQQLHRGGPARSGAVEATLVLVGGLEIGEEGGQGCVVLEIAELSGHIQEGSQRLAPAALASLRARAELDVETDRGYDLMEQAARGSRRPRQRTGRAPLPSSRNGRAT